MYRWDNKLKANRSWKRILFPAPPNVTGTFRFAGRDWAVEVLPGAAYMQRYCPISDWLVLPAGLLLGLLTTSYIGAMLSGRQRLAQLVAQRTAELCQTQEMLQLVLDAIPVRVHWKNRDSVYLGCNRRFAKDAGLNAPQEVAGKTDYDLPWKECAELFRGRDRKVIESGQSMLDYEQLRPTGDGRVLTLLQSKLPLRDAGGGIIGVLSVYEDITKRKEADEALRQSEARYRAVVENSPDGMAVSIDDKLVYVNPAAVRLAGARSAPDLLGRSVLEFVHEDYRSEVERRRVKMLETGLPSPVLESKLRRPDGRIIVAESTGVPILYEGKPAILNSFRDVTEHRRRDRALRASEAKYRQLHESMMDAFVAADLNGRLTECNEAFRQMLGYEPEEILRLNTEDWTPEKWHALDAEIRQAQVLARGYSDVYQKEYRRKDGTVFPVELRTILLKDDTGMPCGMWAIVRDITERKQAEGLLAGEKRVLEWIASRKPLPEALNEICRFIDELSPGVMSSILLLDAGGTQLRPIAAPRLPEEWTRAITPLAIGPSVGSCGTAAWDKEQVIVSDIATDPRWTTYPEFCTLALNCGLRACWSTPILSGEGSSLGTFAVYYREPRSPSARDLDVIGQVTHLASIAVEHHQAAEALRRAHDELEQRVLERTAELVQANQRLEELDRLKSQFLATMSHELRTPLNSIIGFTGILRKGFAGPVNDEQYKELGMVFGSAKHLLSLINDLLDLSRIEAGKVELESEPFNFLEVIEEVVQNLTPLAGQKNLRLATDLPGSGIEMVGDRKRSYQVLLNLANNAVKFTDHGEVKITARVEQDQLRVCVADTGIGIKPEQMGMLFEAFRQLDGTARRVYEGTGLGLHLCRRLLTLMHGEIGAESDFGKGSRFTFTLPRHSNGQSEQANSYEDPGRG
jgi:PAS domain S-box-containing protein